jgi:hypothetical protein
MTIGKTSVIRPLKALWVAEGDRREAKARGQGQRGQQHQSLTNMQIEVITGFGHERDFEISIMGPHKRGKN